MHDGTGAKDALGERVRLLRHPTFGEQRPEARRPPGDRVFFFEHHGKALEGARGWAGTGVAFRSDRRRSAVVLVVALEQRVDRRLDRVGTGGHRVEYLDRRQFAGAKSA
jgi:hypothetical protein